MLGENYMTISTEALKEALTEFLNRRLISTEAVEIVSLSCNGSEDTVLLRVKAVGVANG